MTTMNMETFEDFERCCHARWPEVEVAIGPPQSIDNDGTRYTNICIGGVLQEGLTYPIVCSCSGDDPYAAQQWWLYFEKFVGTNPKKIVVRRLPTASTWTILRLETFATRRIDVPEFVEETRGQINGRFAVYY